MAIAVVIDAPGQSQEGYDAIAALVDFEREPAAGLILHAAGPIEGGWRVIDVWESEQDADRFVQDRLRPALEQAGVLGEPQITVTPLHSLVR